MYVIQHRIHDWDKWDTYSTRYKTLGEAREALAALNPLLRCNCRIAEEYTVVRYKAVKKDGRA